MDDRLVRQRRYDAIGELELPSVSISQVSLCRKIVPSRRRFRQPGAETYTSPCGDSTRTKILAVRRLDAASSYYFLPSFELLGSFGIRRHRLIQLIRGGGTCCCGTCHRGGV